MPHPIWQPYGSRFAPLVAHLAARAEETITLMLAQIEELIGGALSVTVTVSLAWWVSAPECHVRELETLGGRAHLRVKQQAVAFRRTDPEGAA